MKAVVVKKPGRPADPDHCARRREEILDTAVLQFAKQGFANTEMQELADSVGVGKGTLYRYFPSKRELFLAAVERGLQRLHEQIDAVAETVADPI